MCINHSWYCQDGQTKNIIITKELINIGYSKLVTRLILCHKVTQFINCNSIISWHRIAMLTSILEIISFVDSDFVPHVISRSLGCILQKLINSRNAGNELVLYRPLKLYTTKHKFQILQSHKIQESAYICH